MILFVLCNIIIGKCNDNLIDKIFLIDWIINCCVWNIVIRLLVFVCVFVFSYELLYVMEIKFFFLLNKFFYLNVCLYMFICN